VLRSALPPPEFDHRGSLSADNEGRGLSLMSALAVNSGTSSHSRTSYGAPNDGPCAVDQTSVRRDGLARMTPIRASSAGGSGAQPDRTFRQTDRERGGSPRPHDGKANPRRGMRPTGVRAVDGLRLGGMGDLGVTPRTRAAIQARDFGSGKLK
jgi:hypothetical protein